MRAPTSCIEGVAAKAGVGKATIYRWWSSKGAMIVEAFMRGVSPELAFPDTGSAAADIAQQMARLSKVYRGSTGRIVREMIAMGQFDPETLHLLSEGYLRPRREAAKEVLRRGITQGEFRPDIDLDVVIDALYAPIFHRLLIGHARTDAALLQFMTTTVLGGIAPR
jgi:AcrR family transcriptional regulator